MFLRGKKVIALLISIIMCLSLFACSGKEVVDENTVTEPTYEYFGEYNIPMPAGLDVDKQMSENGMNHYYFIVPPVMANTARAGRT